MTSNDIDANNTPADSQITNGQQQSKCQIDEGVSRQDKIFIVSKVVEGFGRGSKDLGCPTSNMDDSSGLNISDGVYCGFAQLCIEDKSQVQEDEKFCDVYKQVVSEIPKVFPVMPMVCSYGNNPHYGIKDKVLEVHILNTFDFNFYGATLRVLLCKWLRDQRKFNSLDELKEAIESDKKSALSECPKFSHLISDKDFIII